MLSGYNGKQLYQFAIIFNANLDNTVGAFHVFICLDYKINFKSPYWVLGAITEYPATSFTHVGVL